MHALHCIKLYYNASHRIALDCAISRYVAHARCRCTALHYMQETRDADASSWLSAS